MSGLTLVSLPIGNKGDITLRAREALEAGKVFYAEDTRVFKEFLGSLGISYQDKFIDSFHDQSVGKTEAIIARLKSSHDVYLVSDAGSPIICDPAYPLLKRLREERIQIKTLPGVTSVIAALELSGLPSLPFHFWGFIARGKGEKKEFFKNLEGQYGTHIFFESPHRIFETVETFFEVHSEKVLTLAREVTKVHESVYHLSQDDLKTLREQVVEKGEFVVLYHNDHGKHSLAGYEEAKAWARDYLENGGGTKKLAKIFSKLLELDTKSVYGQLSRTDKGDS